MTPLTYQVARALGIESFVHVREFADQLDPLVTVTVGTHAIQRRIDVRAYMDSTMQGVKDILSDMYRTAKNM